MPAPSLPEPAAWSREIETFAGTQDPQARPAHARWGVAELVDSSPQRVGTVPGELEDEPRAPIWLHRPPALKSRQSQVEPPTAPDPLDWRPPPTFRERVLGSVGTPALIGVLVFIATVASVVILVLTQPHAAGEDVGLKAGSISEQDQATPNTSTVKQSESGVSEVGGAVFVHVVGEVNSPGVIELKLGDRVQQALEAAGGVTDKAVLGGVNLARLVSDGEQIVVPDSAGAVAAEAATRSTESSGSAAVSPVNLNTADAGLLESLPRVGPALAQRIIEWREANGTFSSVDQLLGVSGIGQKTLDGFRDRVLV